MRERHLLPRVRNLAFVGLLLLPLAAIANCRWATVRAERPFTNAMALIALLVVGPLAALLWAMADRFRQSQQPSSAAKLVLAATALVAAGIACLPVLLAVFLLGLTSSDEAFKRISSTSVGSGTVVTYRTNGGATTSYGIVVRHELPLPFGVKLTRELCSAYRAQTATVARTKTGAILVTIPTYGQPPAIVTCVTKPKEFVFLVRQATMEHLPPP